VTEAEYETANERRLELIEKMHAGFTAEERSRAFADHPGWDAECRRRQLDALTADERAEWARLQVECFAYLVARFPWDAALAARLAELEARLENLTATPATPLPPGVKGRDVKTITLRFRIELCTDESLRWFAEIRTVNERGETSVGWTKTAETWSDALALASERIAAKRGQGGAT
jgi:hypothetical protein